jgi:predicted AAA+ superfamily ATPase
MMKDVIGRLRHVRRVVSLLRESPVVAVLGPRQVGKSTLASDVARRHGGRATVFDLERPRDLDALAEPMLALERRRGLVVIDEVQRRPDLFPVLRVLADRKPLPARFLVLGSASPHHLRQTSESLAGRIAFHELTGFALDETGPPGLDRLWLRGGFPRSYLAATDAGSLRWRIDFVRTFLERDVAELGVSLAPAVLRRFWAMVAQSHGSTWNASGIGRSLGVTDATSRRYLDLLAGMFVVRVLPPWHENLGKRQVKAPKVYVADSGLLHALLDIGSEDALDLSPHVGASWEGFALSQVIERLGARPEQCFFWRTHAGAELDLLVVRGNRRLGFEFKRTDTPGSATSSMHIAAEDLRLDRLDVVHPGPETYAMKGGFRALSLRRLLSDLRPL